MAFPPAHTSQNSFACLLSVLIMAFTLSPGAFGLSQAICSNQNTGTGNSQGEWMYQSNGYCHDLCNPKGFAFAIVKGKDCWCSDYAPYNTQSTNDCSDACVGFPDERCGNQGKGLFGYISLDKKPAGTQGAPSSAPQQTQTKEPSSDPPKSTVVQTSVRTSVAVVTSTFTSTVVWHGSEIYSSHSFSRMKTYQSSLQNPSSSAPASTTSAPASSKEKSSVSSASVVTVVQTSTNDVGSVVTLTVVTSPTAGVQSQEPPVAASRQSLSGGAIAGIAIGAVLGTAFVVAGIGFFLWRWRRNRINGDSEGVVGSNNSSGLQRNTSTMTTSPLNRSYAPTVVIPTTTRQSSNEHSETISPISERRHSRPIFYDQRLNPSSFMEQDNGSRVSLNTLEDNRDYTRQLNIRNPDPPERD